MGYVGKNNAPKIGAVYDELYQPQATRFVSQQITSHNCYHELSLNFIEKHNTYNAPYHPIELLIFTISYGLIK